LKKAPWVSASTWDRRFHWKKISGENAVVAGDWQQRSSWHCNGDLMGFNGIL